MTIRLSASRTVLLLTAALLLGACACPVRADEKPQTGTPEADASRLVEEVLRKAGNGDLADWTRSILDRALERAGETAGETIPGQSEPLSAERHAEGFAARHPASAEVLIFTSLSVSAASWRQWAGDAARSGVPLVLRGVAPEGLPKTAKRILARLGSHKVAIAIDPRLFRLFGIERVPAVVVVPSGVTPCESRGCSDPGSPAPAPGSGSSGAGFSAPPHDRIAGNIGLVAALEAIASEGEAGRETARLYLERMTGDAR